eukprot:jgi/Undpi1/5289/HiC_scaffold_2.g00570.m1
MKKWMIRGAKRLPEDIPTSRESSSTSGRDSNTAGDGFLNGWLKLVKLSFAAAHFADLHRFVLRGHFDNKISARYSGTGHVVAGGIAAEIWEMTRTGFVHLASILHLCPFGTHAGSVSCRRICRARGVTVRMLHHCDTQNRKRRDRNPGLGSTTNKGRLVNDARASHTFVPQTKAPQT